MEKKTYIVKYIGNRMGDIMTSKWTGSLFLVTDGGASWNIVDVLHYENPFELDRQGDNSFFKFNAEVVQGYTMVELEDDLFKLE